MARVKCFPGCLRPLRAIRALVGRYWAFLGCDGNIGSEPVEHGWVHIRLFQGFMSGRFGVGYLGGQGRLHKVGIWRLTMPMPAVLLLLLWPWRKSSHNFHYDLTRETLQGYIMAYEWVVPLKCPPKWVQRLQHRNEGYLES